MEYNFLEKSQKGNIQTRKKEQKMNSILDYLITGRSLKRAYNKYLQEVDHTYGLSRMETDILLFLYNNPGYDTASDIVELRSFAKSNVSKAVENLTQKGYISQIVDKKDRRIIHLSICPEAMDAVAAASAKQKEFLALMYHGVSDQEKKVLEHIFSIITRNIADIS